ncbi:helix-turn-helix domain-containing protein [Amedibacillus sp. YH-ame6]
MDDLRMITQEELRKILNCSESHITFLRELGIIPAIKTGRNYMFSAKAIQEFFDAYKGLDVSNRLSAMKSKELVQSKMYK